MSGSKKLEPENVGASPDFSGPVPATAGVSLAPDGTVSVDSTVPFGTRFEVKATSSGGTEEEIIKCEVVLPINATYFPDAEFRTKMIAHPGHDTDPNFFTITEANNMRRIEVMGSEEAPGTIQSVQGIGYFENIRVVDVSYNDIANLDVSNITTLTSLNCRFNQLAELDVSNNIKLRYLNCRNNPLLATLDMSGCIELITLHAYGNPLLTDLDVSNNTKLKYLNCYGNNMTVLDVSSNTALIELR